MRAQSAVRGPVVRGAWCVVRVPSVLHATRNTQHATASPRLAAATRSRAFTLIEIMIVVAIMGIVMAMSVPIVYKVWRKAPMRQAVKDIVEVCSHARARAIMQGKVTEVIFHPRHNRLELAGAGGPSPAASGSEAEVLGGPAATGSGLSAQLSRDVIIETMDVNMSGVEFNDAESVRVRFYPNGVSDEMKMVLFDGRDRMGIELEITTGLAGVVRDPLREWVRR
jgi:prepilin-type N-terminal cleavage/methylation domain-containing protein